MLEVDPIVELSFMPAFLANCTWHKYATGKSPAVNDIVNPHGNGSCVTGNFYEGGDMQPQRWEDWQDLVFALASHAVERYGLDVVERWHWEVWNGACDSELSWCPFSASAVASERASSSELTTVARLRVVRILGHAVQWQHNGLLAIHAAVQRFCARDQEGQPDTQGRRPFVKRWRVLH